MALPVSSTCQREHIAQSIIYTLSGRLFLVAPSLEKGRTSFRDAQHLLQQYALSTLGLPGGCLKCRCTACAFGDQYLMLPWAHIFHLPQAGLALYLQQWISRCQSSHKWAVPFVALRHICQVVWVVGVMSADVPQFGERNLRIYHFDDGVAPVVGHATPALI